MQARASPKNSQLCSTAAVPAAQCLQRRVSSFLHSSCAVLRSRRVCNRTLQAAAAACKGFPELFAAETVSAAEFARRAGRRRVLRFADVSAVRLSARSSGCTRGFPEEFAACCTARRSCRELFAGVDGRRLLQRCAATSAEARHCGFCDSFAQQKIPHTFWHFFVKRQYL